MNEYQEKALQRLVAGEVSPWEQDPLAQHKPSPDVRALAQVVLGLVQDSHRPVDIRAIIREEIAAVPIVVAAASEIATAADWVVQADMSAITGTDDFDALANAQLNAAPGSSGIIDVSAEPEGPITAEELRRRGCDAELEGRALEIVWRLGFPRDGDPLGIKTCIPVPVVELTRWLEDIRANHAGALHRLDWAVGQLLAEQKHFCDQACA